MKGGDKKIHLHPKANTNGFDKRPHQAGRPKRLISYINSELEKEGFIPTTKDEIVKAYLTMLNIPIGKIIEIANGEDDNFPLFYRLVAKEMTGTRGMEMLEKLLDRSIGKSNQSIDLTSGGKDIGEFFEMFGQKVEVK